MSTTATYTAEYAAESRLPVILGVLTTFFIIALIVVCLRIYVRTIVTHSFGADDILIICAILCQFGGWVAILVQSRHGLGRHQSTLDTETLEVFNHASFWGNVIEIAVGTMFIKLAIAANLLRLCSNRWYTIALWFIIALTIAYELVAFLFFFLNCKPVSGNWDTSVNAKCASLNTIVIFGLVNTSCNIVTDVALAAIPIPIIWGLNMKRTTRLYLIGVLSLGYLAVAMDIVKTVYQETYTASVDETYTFSLITFGFLYGTLGIIASSVPMLKPLVSRVLGLDSTQDHSYYAYNSNGGNPSHIRTIGGTRGNGTRGGGARSAVRRGDGTQVGNGLDDPTYELDERDSDPGSDRKSDGINSTSVYRHDIGSQDNILYHVPGVSNKTTIENGNVNPNRSDSSLNGTPGGGTGSINRQQSGNFRGIKMTTEVSVKR